MILYFSGTGNSEFAAKFIGKELDDRCVSLADKIKDKDYSPLESEKPFVVVCPTYAWRIPRVVSDFILKTTFKGNKDIYFVMTCGGEIGNAGKYIEDICKDKNLNYKGVFEVKMPDNYIAMFNIGTVEADRAVIKNANGVLLNVCKVINENMAAPERKASLQDKILSGVVNGPFYSIFVKDKKFYVKNDCISCGLCAKNCPLGNIEMINNKPTWKGDCTHCMKCISYCPKSAIEYGNATKGKRRYTFPKNDIKI